MSSARDQPGLDGIPEAERLARQVRVLQTLQREGAAAALDPEANLRAALRLACHELGFAYGAVAAHHQGRLQLVVAGDASGTPLAAVPLDPERWEAAAANGHRPPGSRLTLPLVLGEEVVGALTLWSDEPRPPCTDADREVAAYVATHIATILFIQARLAGVTAEFERINSAPDEALFERLVQSAARMLRVRYAFLTECIDADLGLVRTLAVWTGERLGENVEYRLAGTPCAAVFETGRAFHADGVAARFRADARLSALDARGYLGVRIAGSDGTTCGHLAVVDVAPIAPSAFDERLLADLASRAAAGFERERARESLRASEERLALAISTGRIGVWDFNATEHTLHMNEHAKAVVGWEGETFPLDARVWRDLIHPDDLHRPRRMVAEPGADEFVIEHRVRHRDGSYRWVLARGRIVRDATGRVVRVICAGTDTTERRRLEAKVQQTQRLESLGLLAGGIAHDFNNLLMSVLGNAALARRMLPEDAPALARLHDVERAVQRASDLTNELLAYSGSGSVAMETLDLRDAVADIATLLETVVSKKASLVLEHHGAQAVIDADPGQLRQVIMNLITNASDALADAPGTITVSTGTVRLDDAFRTDAVAAEVLEPGTYAIVEVRDTGVGMDEETRSRVFDPFFTTKFTGRGLGMAAVLGIVRGHHGAIRIRSTPGAGTVATVLFPLSERALPVAAPPSEPEPLRGRGTVLLVDDEADIRRLLAVALTGTGFEVLTAADGEAGVELFHEHAERIRLVVLDMTMPKLGGDEVVAAIRARVPAVPIILMSGYTADRSLERLTQTGSVRFLKKPFRVDVLLNEVRDALDGPDSV